MRQTVTICSVFFRPLHAERNRKPVNGGGWFSQFDIPACGQGEYKTLKVGNHLQRSYVGNGEYAETPVYADGPGGMADGLVNEWAKNVQGGERGGPGVFICAGDEPTKEEIDRALKTQTAWADYLCLLAEVSWVNGKKTDITGIQREAAVWLGRTTDYEWVSESQARTIPCPLCTKPIDGKAIICPSCGAVVDFERYADYQTRKAELDRKLGAAQVKSPVPPPIQVNQTKRVGA